MSPSPSALTITGLALAVGLLSITTLRLKHRLDALRASHSHLLAQSNDAQSQVTALKEELELSKSSHEQEKLSTIQHLSAEWTTTHSQTILKLTQTQTTLQTTQTTLEKLQEEHERLRDHNGKLKRDLGVLNDRYAKQDTLLEQRTAELKGAEAYLSKADSVSGAEVVGMVESLNGEIMQLAAMLAEEFVVEEGERQKLLLPMSSSSSASASASGSTPSSVESSPPTNESSLEKDGDFSPPNSHPHPHAHSTHIDNETYHEALVRTEEILGARMTLLLRSAHPSRHFADPTLVQMAFQTALAAYAHWIVSSWCFENPEDEGLWTEVYARVREAEEQAISGRWRQLTRKHLQRMLSNTNTPADLSSDMADAFTQILITAGTIPSSILSSPRSDNSATLVEDTAQPHPLPLPQTLQTQILHSYAPRIQRITKMSQDLNRVIGEGVTSCDLEALFIGAEVKFSAETMEIEEDLDVNGGDHDRDQEREREREREREKEMERGRKGKKEKDSEEEEAKTPAVLEVVEVEDPTGRRSITPTPRAAAAAPTFMGGMLSEAPLSLEGEEVDEHVPEPGSSWSDDEEEEEEEDESRDKPHHQDLDQDRDSGRDQGIGKALPDLPPPSPIEGPTQDTEKEVQEEEEEEDGDIVLCTTDLGLVRAEKVPGTVGEWYESVLLKPRVVLVRMVRGMFSFEEEEGEEGER